VLRPKTAKSKSIDLQLLLQYQLPMSIQNEHNFMNNKIKYNLILI